MTSTTRLAFATAAILAALSPPLQAQWGPVTPSNLPAGRSGALMAYDLPGARILMFGGEWNDEFWMLQNNAWTQLQPSQVPTASKGDRWAVNSVAGTMLLYGGYTGGRNATDQTWQWDGTNWTQLSPAVSPFGIANHSMAFDEARQVVVMFGGNDDSWQPQVHLGDTWEFANGNWALQAPPTSVPARIDAAMSYHPVLSQIILFGGEDGGGLGLDDTWIYDGVTWTQINQTSTRPAPRAGAHMVSVITRSSCTLVGGRDPMSLQLFNDTWQHDGTNWMQMPPSHGSVVPARHSFAMAHDIARNRIVVVGGKTSNGALPTATWEHGAHWRSFGNGCSGTAGRPTFTGGTLPRLGQTCDAQITNMPTTNTLALIAIGLSRQQWSLGSLPTLLTNFGMPGCRAYTSADAFVAVGANGGTAQWSWNVPSAAAFVGSEFHLQGLVFDATANAGGAIVTNASTLVVGW